MLVVVIISKSIYVSNHPAVHLNTYDFICQLYHKEAGEKERVLT